MKIGIDALALYCPHYFLDLRLLAEKRGVPYEKFYVGIGQEKMAIPAPDEDVVTMAANAAHRALGDMDLSELDSIIFATESGIDQSKAAAVYVHQLLDLPTTCKAFEVKQACCSSTMAVLMAMGTVALNPKKKVLVVASDIARYGFKTSGESTQGAGASAVVISANPRLVVLDADTGSYTEDVMDFWRPNYLECALVDGKFSMKMYLKALTHAWDAYCGTTGAKHADFDRFIYHLPFTRMAEKAHAQLAKHAAETAPRNLLESLRDSLHYSRLTGNCYTASLYISLSSLLENSREDLTGKRLGLFSYGSGCVGTFFSGTICSGYEEHLHRSAHYRMITERQELTWAQYIAFYEHSLPEDGSDYMIDIHDTGHFRLAGIHGHQRIYQSLLRQDIIAARNEQSTTTTVSQTPQCSVIGN